MGFISIRRWNTLSERIIQLQNILLPQEDVCTVEELYFHREKNQIQFDGYFNLFAVDKWRAYSQIDNLYLHLTCKGFKALVLMCQRKEIGRIMLNADTEESYDIEFPYQDADHKMAVWFSLVPVDENAGTYTVEYIKQNVKGYFYSKTVSFIPRQVNIAADICTFKREHYVYRNLMQLKKNIFDKENLEVKDHFQIFIIDNGKTLETNRDVISLVNSCYGKIKIFKNKNAGGAGGFTRGMMEAIKAQKQDRLTHVLLMDDDAVNEPDSIVRLYALLTTLKEEWKDVAVGGAILREDFPFLLREMGSKYKNGKMIFFSGKRDMRLYENVAIDYILEPGEEKEMYSGWWFYCAPLTTVRKDNLPLPLFIHMDDIEYGLRNLEKGIIFLNGVSVWHPVFDVSDSPLKVYSDQRNGLIVQALKDTNDWQDLKELRGLLSRLIITFLVRYRYKDVEILCRAIQDYLKGPECFMNTDPEEKLKEIMPFGVKAKPLSEVENLNDAEKKQVQVTIQEFTKEKLFESVEEARHIKRLKYVLSLNGWFLPSKEKLKVLPMACSPIMLCRYRKITFFEPDTGKIVVGEKNFLQLMKSFIMWGRWCLLFLIKRKKLKREYQAAFSEMTSMEFWEKYLQLKNSN